MVTVVPIRIEISTSEAERGSDTIIRELEDIRRQLRRLSDNVDDMSDDFEESSEKSVNALDTVKTALVSLGSYFALSSLVDLSNQFIELKNRVLLVTDGITEANSVLSQLFDIADRVRTPIGAVAELFQKTSTVAKELSANREDVLKFVEVVGKALSIQGGSTQSAEGALTQLGQSLGGAKIQAEEFNSIMDGAYPIVLAAAKGIDEAGGSVSRLKKLVTEGKVTNQEFFRAILSQAEDLDSQFQKTNASIASAGIVLKNEFLRFIGESEGLIGLLSSGLIILADNLGTLLKVALAFGAGLLVAFSPTIIVAAITAITVAVDILTVSIAANPIGFWITVITASIALVYEFSDKILVLSDNITTLADVGRVVFGDIWSLVKKTYDIFVDGVNKIVSYFGLNIPNISNPFTTAFKSIVFVMDKIVGVSIGVVMAIVNTFDKIPAAFVDIFSRAFNGAIGLAETGTNKIISALNNIPGVAVDTISLSKIENSFEGGFKSLGDTAQKSFLEGFNSDYISKYLDGVSSRANALAQERLKTTSVKDSIPIPAANDNGKGGDVASKILVPKPRPDSLDRVKTGLGDVKTSLEDLYKPMNNFGQAFDSMMSKAEDSIVKLVRTGKFSFSDLINSMLDDLARLSAKQFVIDPLSNSVKNSFSNLFTDNSGGLGPIINSSANDNYRPSSDFVGPLKPNSEGFFSNIGSSIGSFFSFDKGVDYVPKDMFAKLHRGERVVTADKNKEDYQSSNITVNLNITGITNYDGFRENRSAITSSLAKSLQTSLTRNA